MFAIIILLKCKPYEHGKSMLVKYLFIFFIMSYNALVKFYCIGSSYLA